ncbi:hypothetical protein [Bifidobacterium olomucense]|uniref:Uncharacterized protein n=1 Tax=Bifidobacterium olomucense TaxID=2675324 RepID=A0A7Y0EYQ2_9BIFI|nr:hypothetical protein [Bifidobacterium sp. DSM 109959]NMM98871.1 hypothetical protein [Bifidobacterium sp. DSM 109959]
MGFILLNTAYMLRVPYNNLGAQIKAPRGQQPRAAPNVEAAHALRERDWNMLNYLAAKSVDPQTFLADRLMKDYGENPDKYDIRARPLPCWVCRPISELIGRVLGKDSVTGSTVNMAMDSLRRLERCHLLRLHGSRRGDKMPLTELLIIARAEEFGVPVEYPKARRGKSGSATNLPPTDLAGNTWDADTDGDGWTNPDC